MEILTRLSELPVFHPRLLWTDLSAAAAAVVAGRGGDSPYPIDLAIDNVPSCEHRLVRLLVDIGGVEPTHVERLRRTYDRARLVELPAIAIAGLGLYHAGGHESRDVAARGSGADYLVDESLDVLEVAGRSRRTDFASAWQQKRQRLRERIGKRSYLCVVEFETPHGRVAFEP